MSIAEGSSIVSARPRARKMTKELILSGTTFPRNRDETAEHYLDRITHLHLQCKKIRHIEGLEHSSNLQVLYLYDNYIETIENIDHIKTLKSLFISNNLITHIPELQNTNLDKLRLDDNEIEVVQGLEGLGKLQELSIATQRIQTELQFDYRSLQAICDTLRYLDVSRNNITTLAPLSCLGYLEHLICVDNKILDLIDLEPLSSFRYMEELNLKGNPVCKVYRYRDTLIGYSSSTLREVDELPLTGKKIESMRAVAMHRQKVEQKKSRSRASGDEGSLDGGLDAKRTLEDSNDYRNDGGGGNWSDLHL